jgi:hypothetical protein
MVQIIVHLSQMPRLMIWPSIPNGTVIFFAADLAISAVMRYRKGSASRHHLWLTQATIRGGKPAGFLETRHQPKHMAP